MQHVTPTGTPPVAGRWAASDTGGAASESETTPGAWAPGTLRRDIVIPLDRPVPGAEPGAALPDLRYVELRLRNDAEEFELEIDGISCFHGGPEGEELDSKVLDYPVRIIPWPVRTESFVLLLGMDQVKWVQLPIVAGGDPIERAEGTALWHFSARQLRELTWCRFGAGLLLLHHDFPAPLYVQLPGQDADGTQRTFRIQALDLQNMAHLPSAAFARVLPDVSSRGDEVRLGHVRPDSAGAVVPHPTDQILSSGVTATGAMLRWADTGADSYEIEYQEKP